MVATIAPGPANSGVPSGTRATFLSRASVEPESFPVNNSSETSNSKSLKEFSKSI